MPDVVITTEPIVEQTEETEDEVSWQSVFSEVREAILSGFSSLRNEMETQRNESQAREARLIEANTNLTSQITQANQTLMDRLTSLSTSNPSTSEIVVVSEPTPESVVEENPEVETSSLETEANLTRRKRRTL